MAISEITVRVKLTRAGRALLWAAERIAPAHERGAWWARAAGAVVIWLALRLSLMGLDMERTR